MKLNEFEVKAASDERLECLDCLEGEECARQMARMLRAICRRCMEIGWTFEEVAEEAMKDVASKEC